MGLAFGNDWSGNNYFLFIKMKFKYSIKTDCFACLGVVKEIIKKIPGVLNVDLDLKEEKVIIDYEGELTREKLAKIIKEKTGHDLI